MPLLIIHAAVLIDGHLVKGRMHAEAYCLAAEAGLLASLGVRSAEEFDPAVLTAALWQSRIVEGFLTSAGEFVDRSTARAIGLQARQLNPNLAGTEARSEDFEGQLQAAAAS